MRKDLRSRMADDAGMSLIELVIAAVVLLIAIMGLFGTIYTSTVMSLRAKEQNVAVNTANSYAEMVRALPYDSVGVMGAASPDPTGTLAATSTFSVSNLNVVLNPRVTWVADPRIASAGGKDYKELQVTVTVTAASGRAYTQTFRTYIRRSDALQSGFGGGGGNPPSIVFTTGSKFLDPPPIYVYGTGETVSAFAQVASSSSATLKNIEFRCDGTLLTGTGGADGSNAAWVNAGGTSNTFTFTWDTTSADATTGVQLFPDGQRVLRILVWDTMGGYRYRDTPVIIDNYAPIPISSPPVLVRRDSASASTISWGPSWDGPYSLGISREFANHYVMHVFRETGGWVDRVGVYPPDLGDTESDTAYLGPGALGSNPTTNSATVPTEPLRRYWIKIEPHSYRHLSAGLTTMLTPFVTRPSLAVTGTPSISVSGSGSNTQWTMTTSVKWQEPQFHFSSVIYRLERSTSPTFATVDWSQSWGGIGTLSATNAYTVTGNSTPAPYYYRLVCMVLPSGQYNDGSTYTLYSNTLVMKPTVTGSGSSTVRTLPYTSDWSGGQTP